MKLGVKIFQPRGVRGDEIGAQPIAASGLSGAVDDGHALAVVGKDGENVSTGFGAGSEPLRIE